VLGLSIGQANDYSEAGQNDLSAARLHLAFGVDAPAAVARLAAAFCVVGSGGHGNSVLAFSR
jgi:hypothetical protein